VIAYVDTSVVLQVLFRQGPPHRTWGRWERAYTSDLLGVEARRMIDRLRLLGAVDDEGVATAHQQLGTIEESIGRIALNRPVLRRASLPLPTVVKTLDAIHLASALLLQERLDVPVHFVTHDDKLLRAAISLGFSS
jgi:predicted nucleic acid-binding protein